jgi:hypothetical protein
LQLPITGHPLHTRSVTTVIALSPDGGWKVRGDIIDLRKRGFVPMSSDIQPAGIIHQMAIDLDVDPATATIEQVAVDQPVVAIEPSGATGGECCRDPAPRLLELAGERLDGRFAKQLSAKFGGAFGCSHLLTLFQSMAAATRRALVLEGARDASVARTPGERLFRRSAFIDGHEAADGSVQIGIQLADFYTNPAAGIESPLERLAGQWDVRAFARVGDPGMTTTGWRLAERYRDHTTLAEAKWRDRGDRVRSLEGVSILGGLARQLFAIFRDAPGEELLLDALLQFAPGHIQVMAAVMDRWYTRPAGGDDAAAPSGMPAVGQIGGRADSCYMWRTEGPMARTRFSTE